MNASRLDAYLTGGPPEHLAWEAWCGAAKVGDPCEVVGRHVGLAIDDDNNESAHPGGNVTGTIVAITDDVVTVFGADGMTYTLDWSDVGPVTGY